MKAFWFDMDGTIANLYGEKDWLQKLNNKDTAPYANAKPLVPPSNAARQRSTLSRVGFCVRM